MPRCDWRGETCGCLVAAMTPARWSVAIAVHAAAASTGPMSHAKVPPSAARRIDPGDHDFLRRRRATVQGWSAQAGHAIAAEAAGRL